jgi:hypothetical protein
MPDAMIVQAQYRSSGPSATGRVTQRWRKIFVRIDISPRLAQIVVLFYYGFIRSRATCPLSAQQK